MLRVSLFLPLAAALAATTAAAADPPAPPAAPHGEPPAFQPISYRPFSPGDSLPDPTPPPDMPPARLVPEPEHARRPFQAGFGFATLPFECLSGPRACGSSSALVGIQWRSFPHYAWTLAGERTALVSGDSYYLGAGARVFAYERGTIDPFLELNLGGEVTTEAQGVAFAGNVVFGLALYLFDHLQLAPLLEFRHSERGWGACHSSAYACNHWSQGHTNWVALGLSVEAMWGPPE